jgi:hypothetical protein
VGKNHVFTANIASYYINEQTLIKKIINEIGVQNSEVVLDHDAAQMLLDEMISDPDYGKKISDGAVIVADWKE